MLLRDDGTPSRAFWLLIAALVAFALACGVVVGLALAIPIWRVTMTGQDKSLVTVITETRRPFPPSLGIRNTDLRGVLSPLTISGAYYV